VPLACLAAAGIPVASAASAGAAALPRFALFGWVSPPRESTTAARYAELASTGFNTVLLEWNDSGTYEDNRVRLDASRPFGLRNLLLDNDLARVSITAPATFAFADTIVARYKGDPAFLGYYLGDEPPASSFPRLGDWFQVLRERDPEHPAWNDLGPRGAFPSQAAFLAYVQAYVDATHPAVLCNNQYDFSISGDTHHLTENIATLSAVARANGIPFWGIVQLVEHWQFRHVTAGMLRWQIAQWLAWGTGGIGYFTYWTPPPSSYDWQPAMIEWGTGARTPYFDTVTALNARLAPLGNTLAGLSWTRTEYAGSLPSGGEAFARDTALTAVDGRATIGLFADSTGLPCVFVANADSLSPRTVTLTLTGGRRASRLRDDGATWDSLAVDANGRVALALDAGDFALLRLSVPANGEGPTPAAGRLDLRAAPNPAAGSVQFDASGAAGVTRLRIFDLAGHVVWSHVFPAGSPRVTWSGERDDGGRARAGVYFARLEDGRTASSRRVVWLGAP